MKKSLVVKNRKVVVEVDPQDIIYILRDGRRLIVAAQDGEYVYSQKIDKAAEVCVENFYRPVERCLVNLTHLKGVDVVTHYLTFKNGDAIPLGKHACSRTKKAFEKYLIDNADDPEAELAAEEENEYKK